MNRAIFLNVVETENCCWFFFRIVFRFFVMVVANLIVISSSLNCVANGEVISSNKIITEFLFLPFCKKNY